MRNNAEGDGARSANVAPGVTGDAWPTRETHPGQDGRRCIAGPGSNDGGRTGCGELNQRGADVARKWRQPDNGLPATSQRRRNHAQPDSTA
eukprot:11196175-Lingulodinium_polyedra.AAC.1